MDAYKDVYRFEEIIPVSALRKTNTDTLILEPCSSICRRAPSIMTRIR